MDNMWTPYLTSKICGRYIFKFGYYSTDFIRVFFTMLYKCCAKSEKKNIYNCKNDNCKKK